LLLFARDVVTLRTDLAGGALVRIGERLGTWR